MCSINVKLSTHSNPVARASGPLPIISPENLKIYINKAVKHFLILRPILKIITVEWRY